MTSVGGLQVQQRIPAMGRLFLSLLERLRIGQLTVSMPDGDERLFGEPHAHLTARLVLSDWRACGSILRAGDIGFAEAYREGWLDSPDLLVLVQLALRNESVLSRTVSGGPLARLWYGLRHWLRPNTRRGSRRNIHAHYDIGNDFYALWLDPSWTYSSAWFAGDLQRSLEQAQQAKYQRIIDALQLKAGMRVLEIGCGWGGFAMYAGQQGVQVHGVTISPAQLEVAQARVRAAGLGGQVTLELCDYRDLHGEYDAIVSIEMFEAVGERFWSGYFQVLDRHLAPGARALVQSITIDNARFSAYRASSDFIREYIFPGGMLPSPERFVQSAGRNGLVATPVLKFGGDYGLTLRRWREQFEANLPAIRAQGFDEVFIRTWRLYLIYCEASFVEGRTDVMHFLVERGD